MNTAKAGYTAADEPTGTYQKEKPLRSYRTRSGSWLKKEAQKTAAGRKRGREIIKMEEWLWKECIFKECISK